MRDFSGLMKIAGVPPTFTVGDFMNRWNGDIKADPFQRHDAFGRINRAGLDVKQPASRIPYVLGGSVLGRAAANYLGSNPFWKNVATIAGAALGNNYYKKNNPNPRSYEERPGVIVKGW